MNEVPKRFRCLACEVGASVEPECWICGEVMESGEICAAGICFRFDRAMSDCCTKFFPADPLALKKMDGLMVKIGEVDPYGVLGDRSRLMGARDNGGSS